MKHFQPRSIAVLVLLLLSLAAAPPALGSVALFPEPPELRKGTGSSAAFTETSSVFSLSQPRAERVAS